MATLVLTTIGGAFGGPIGAMLGGLLGQRVDREIFKPKGREGPRLTELKVQTSSYGTPIPKLFGKLRVAGSVIWATDLIEHRRREGGKGRPTTTSYSYTASFAVALSARPIVGVGRIWADGKLVRGAAGDWKAATGFRLHLGGEDQAADPLIASAEGNGLTPAHRGIAYAVFEHLELGDFGNRIPSLTFEVRADPGEVSAGAIVEAVSAGAVRGEEVTQPVSGFSAYGDTQRSVIEPLANAMGAWIAETDEWLCLRAGRGAGVAVTDRSLDATGSGGRRAIAAADRAPRHIALSHYDPARDYQAGLQQAGRPGPGYRAEAVELPAALAASAAKALAHAMLARADCEREQRTIVTGWQALAIAPGERVTIAGESGQWRVAESALESMAVTLELVPLVPPAPGTSATSGRFMPSPDAEAGETIVRAFEMPYLGTGKLTGRRISIAACGTRSGWRRAALAISSDGGARWDGIGSTAMPAIIGSVETAAGPASAAIEDLQSTLVVKLAHAGMMLADADTRSLDGGANLAWVGGELLQFGQAEPLGDARWRLRRLWRGRRGSEASIGTGTGGEAFVLIEAESLVQHDIPIGAADVQVIAVAPGDGEGVSVAARGDGSSVAPPSPVNLVFERQGDGGGLLTWVRRSRMGWDWTDGIDTPLGEEQESYRVWITALDGAVTETTCLIPQCTIPAAMRATGPLQIAVRQAGDLALSPPATIIIPALEG